MPKSKLCAVDDCNKPSRKRGWCQNHYARWRRGGDPLGIGTTHGEPMRFVVENVLPYTGDDCLIWPYTRNNRGRAQMHLPGQSQLVSRYVCEKANGPPPTPEHEAAHECGKGHTGCITPRHLTWKTASENAADKIRHGTGNQGSGHWNSRLCAAHVREILTLKGKHSASEIGERFGISRRHISDILSGKSWQSLS